MKVVIVGLGRVGLTLAKVLCDEGHSIVAIERNPDTLQECVNHLDIQGIVGNGCIAENLLAASQFLDMQIFQRYPKPNALSKKRNTAFCVYSIISLTRRGTPTLFAISRHASTAFSPMQSTTENQHATPASLQARAKASVS